MDERRESHIEMEQLVTNAKSIVVTPDDTPEDVSRKEWGYHVQTNNDNTERIARTYRRWERGVGTEHGYSTITDVQDNLTNNFLDLAILTATNHPVLNELQMTPDAIAGGLFKGANEILSDIRLQQGVNAGLSISGVRLMYPNHRLRPMKDSLEAFQNNILNAGKTSSATHPGRQ